MRNKDEAFLMTRPMNIPQMDGDPDAEDIEDTDSLEDAVSQTRLVISALRSGRAMKSRDVAALVAERTGRVVRVERVSGVLSRLANPDKSDLAPFLVKEREGGALIYRLVEEAAALPDDVIHGLAIRRGPGARSLEEVLTAYPALGKYRPSGPVADTGKGFSVRRVLDRGAGFVRLTRMAPSEDPDRIVHLNVRYSPRCAVAVTAPLPAFILMVLALTAALAAVGILLYVFVFHLVLTLAAVVALGWLGLWFWRSRRGRS